MVQASRGSPQPPGETGRVSEEIEANLQFHIEHNIRAGMTPEQARRQARMRFGSLEAVKEEVRDRRRVPFIETFVQDNRLERPSCCRESDGSRRSPERPNSSLRSW